jgi:hypothetical protein
MQKHYMNLWWITKFSLTNWLHHIDLYGRMLILIKEIINYRMLTHYLSKAAFSNYFKKQEVTGFSSVKKFLDYHVIIILWINTVMIETYSFVSLQLHWWWYKWCTFVVVGRPSWLCLFGVHCMCNSCSRETINIR